VGTSTIWPSRQDAGDLGQEIEHVQDRATAAADGESFEDLGCQDKGGDHESGKELADGQSGDEGDGHGELHGHAPLDDILPSLLKDGVTADQRGGEADDAQAVEGSHQRNHTATAARATKATRRTSTRSMPPPWWSS